MGDVAWRLRHGRLDRSVVGVGREGTWRRAMTSSQWHKFYLASVAAPAERLFDLLADMPNYGT